MFVYIGPCVFFYVHIIFMSPHRPSLGTFMIHSTGVIINNLIVLQLDNRSFTGRVSLWLMETSKLWVWIKSVINSSENLLRPTEEALQRFGGISETPSAATAPRTTFSSASPLFLDSSADRGVKEEKSCSQQQLRYKNHKAFSCRCDQETKGPPGNSTQWAPPPTSSGLFGVLKGTKTAKCVALTSTSIWRSCGAVREQTVTGVRFNTVSVVNGGL